MRIPRLFAAAVAAGVLVLVQAVSVSPAHAGVYDMSCKYDHATFNACLSFHYVPDLVNNLDVQAGLDALMSQQYAQEIVSHGADVRASLWGDDDGRGQFLVDLLVTPGWPVAGPGGFSVALYEDDLWKVYLNEDAVGDDEIYAVISYFDYHQPARRKSFRTGIVRGDFAPIIGDGTPQCVALC